MALLLSLCSLDAGAQADRKEVRAGNREFDKEHWQQAEIDYRRALVKDSTSIAASYNLASTLYRQGLYDEAGGSLDKVKEAASVSRYGADYFYNLGNIACMKKDWGAAVEAYRQSLLRNPGDMDAKENYAYAKQMLKNQGGGGGGQQDQQNQQNQDQQNQQNQDQQNQQNQNQNQQDQQNQDQNQDQNQQNQDQNQDQGEGKSQGEPKVSPQQAQQMLKAIQAREKETQDKVNREKAAALKSRQKEKNW